MLAFGGLKMTPKDKKIIEDSERDGIPIFVLTAKDYHSVEAIAGYFKDCVHGGCNFSHLQGVVERFNEFKKWQIDNIKLVKTPD